MSVREASTVLFAAIVITLAMMTIITPALGAIFALVAK